MALKLIATYSKRLGLPGYSSHQFSVCVETEISNIDDVAIETNLAISNYTAVFRPSSRKCFD